MLILGIVFPHGQRRGLGRRNWTGIWKRDWEWNVSVSLVAIPRVLPSSRRMALAKVRRL